jgi:hypothetical protein
MLAAARRGLRLGHTDANTHTDTMYYLTQDSAHSAHTTPRLSCLLCQRKHWTVDHSKGDGQLSIAKQGSERELIQSNPYGGILRASSYFLWSTKITQNGLQSQEWMIH